MFGPLLEQLSVARIGPGRPRTRPDRVLGDKAYSSRANRALLRGRGIEAVISEPSDQAGHRRRRGSAGGRPPAFDAEAYRRRNTVERSFQRPQAVARHRNPLRQTRRHLPRRRRPTSHHHLAQDLGDAP